MTASAQNANYPNPENASESNDSVYNSSMVQYILQNMQEHNLEKTCPDYVCDAKATLYQNFDYNSLPKKRRNFIRFANTMLGRNTSNSLMMNNPLLDVTIETQITRKDGIAKAGEKKITYSNIDLSSKDERGLKSIVQFPSDKHAKTNHPGTGILNPKSSVSFKYKGAYEENGRTIYVLERPYCHIEIVKDLWCYRAIRYTQALNGEYSETIYDEVKDGVYLPIVSITKMKQNADEVTQSENEWPELKSEAHDNAERIRCIEDMQQNHSKKDVNADVVFAVTYKYNI